MAQVHGGISEMSGSREYTNHESEGGLERAPNSKLPEAKGIGLESEYLDRLPQIELPEAKGLGLESEYLDPSPQIVLPEDKRPGWELDTSSLECLKAQNESIKLPTRNESLGGSKHPETGVEFEKKSIEVNGEVREVIVPIFDSEFDAMLPDDLKEALDKDQFAECNRKLKEAIDADPELKAKFDEQQLEQIENGATPDGYTWHHDAEAGKMQLVDTETHSKTGHTGGKSIWGGGSENR